MSAARRADKKETSEFAARDRDVDFEGGRAQTYSGPNRSLGLQLYVSRQP